MAVEKNPNKEKSKDNIINLDLEKENRSENVNFELDPETGELEVEFSDDANIEDEEEEEGTFYENLADSLEEDDLEDIANTVIEKYDADKSSRAEWESMFERGFDLLGLKLEDTTEPFEGAATAVHPLLIESAVKFQSKASGELFPSKGPVKVQILGNVTESKQKQGNRVQNFLNYQVSEQMPEFFDETERMLFHLPLLGSAFKKIYYDDSLERPVSEFVPIDQFYVSYYATDLRRADRYTHILYRSPIELARQINAGMYRDIDLPDPELPRQSVMAEKMDTVLGLSPSSESDPQYTLLEQHCYLELEDYDTACPYIVTVEEQSQKVLSIRRNWNEKDRTKQKKMFFTHYRFVPGFGFYGLGLIHFLGNLTMSATAAMRSLIDAGQFANLQGGFKAKGVKVVGDNDPIAPGEFKEVEATGMDLNKSIIMFPYKEPSQTLYNMMQYVAGAGQKFADTTEQIISEGANYGPVGTTMALLEASSKFFSAIHKRLHKAQREEFKILARIDSESLPNRYPYDVPGESSEIFKLDFDDKIDIIPVSDPNIPSSAHRLMMVNMAMQLAQNAPPGMFNMEELNRTVLQAANIPNLENILPEKPKSMPLDPITDIEAATKGLPIKAFTGQNHDAHIQIKTMFLQDPANGGNPIMQRVSPVLQANIQEHIVMKYQEQVNGVTRQMMSQAPQGSVNIQDPKVVEQVMAKAAEQVMAANKAQAQKGGGPEQQMVQIEGQRLQIEKQKIQAQLAKEASEGALKNRDLDLKEQKIALDAYKVGAEGLLKAEEKDKDRNTQQAMNAVKMLVEMIKQGDSIQSAETIKTSDVLIKMLEDAKKERN
tara:strand:- start:13132 stop:15618 length:2487 start_codon:yes stop_codon:yes gene_type:complete